MSAPAALPDANLLDEYRRVRQLSEWLCEPLSAEDMGLQACPEVSPPRWHLAHTTWFFETFLLKPALPGYRTPHPEYEYLFNSYYNGIGEQFPRPQRHLLSRPGLAEVMAWREHVDQAMAQLLSRHTDADIIALAELGIHHEQQHQELLVTDLKFSLSHNPLHPVYRETAPASKAAPALEWQAFEGGLTEIGAHGTDFCFDNETPRHRVWLEPFRLANRPVTNGEFRAFVENGGYQSPEHWLSDGWAWCQEGGHDHPLYWQRDETGQWRHYTLGGRVPLDDRAPACHLNYYEADAYARWAGKRLPTEAEWEHAAEQAGDTGHCLQDGLWQPGAASGTGLLQMIGDVWEWTASAYLPYPGFRAAAGAVGEYNGKFMCNQMVLRGGSCVTDRAHIRNSYRNFFYPWMRWQFTGVRLADDAGSGS
jgi:ergothioneine biosynthesis protein EgtB